MKPKYSESSPKPEKVKVEVQPGKFIEYEEIYCIHCGKYSEIAEEPVCTNCGEFL